MEVASKNNQIGLPYSYQVEWLEGDGASYIDTGIILTDKTYVEIEAGLTAEGQNWLFGIRQSPNYDIVCSGAFYIDCNTQQCIEPIPITLDGTKYKLVCDYNKFYIDGKLLASFQSSPIKPISMYLFAVNRSPILYGKWRIYSAKLSDGINSVDLVPVVKDNVGCMYDKISGKLFENKGAGNFIIGPDIEGGSN